MRSVTLGDAVVRCSGSDEGAARRAVRAVRAQQLGRVGSDGGSSSTARRAGAGDAAADVAPSGADATRVSARALLKRSRSP